MALSESSLREVSKATHPHNLVLIFAAAAALSLAPAPAFAQHGGGGGGGHAGGGGFGGGGGHFGGGGGGHFGGGGGGHASGGGGYHGGGGGYRVEGGGSSGGAVESAHGSANSTGGGHWWSGLFGHHSNGNAEAGARGETSGPGAAGGNSQAAIAAQRAFANSVARDNLAIHNTWQDPPPEFSGARTGASFSGNAFASGTTAPRGNSLVNARPFTPPAGIAAPRVGAPTGGLTTAPRTRLLAGQPRAAVAATNGPFGFYRRRYVGYPYYYSPYLYGGLGYGFYGGLGYGLGCDPFWFGWGGGCFGYGAPFWGGYGGFGYGGYGYGGFGYFGDSYPDDSSAPNYQVFSGGADSGPDDSGASASNGANGNYTYQNSPQDTGVAADQSGGSDEQPFVLYLKDGSSYAVTRYWVAGGKLHYMTTYGGENSVALDHVDVQKTVDENAALGHTFTLAPAPGVQPDAAPTDGAPPSQGPPPSQDNAPPQN